MAADMKTQIDEHSTYIDAREGQANHNILTQFKKGLLVQINMQEPFSVADATMLIGAIKTSRFPADIQKELEEAVECRAKDDTGGKKKGKLGNGKRQLLKTIWNYPTAEDWNLLLDTKKSWTSKACVLLHRMNIIDDIDSDSDVLDAVSKASLQHCQKKYGEQEFSSDQ